MKLFLPTSLKAKNVFVFVLFLLLAKFSTAQTLDSSFGVHGKQTIALNYDYPSVKSAAFQSNNIVVSEYQQNDDNSYPAITILGFKVNGELEDNINISGSSVGSSGGYMIVQPDNKILIAATDTREFGFHPYHTLLIRLLPNGQPDKTFGDNGKAYIGISSIFYRVLALTLRPDGKILISGDLKDDKNGKIALIQLSQNGNFDSGFGKKGVIYQTLSNVSVCHVLKILPDNKILAGFEYNDNGSKKTCIIRYTAQGEIDEGFGLNGIVINQNKVQAQSSDYLIQLGLQPNNKVLAYVHGTPYNFLYRYNEDGSADSLFGEHGSINVPGPSDLAIAIEDNGKILLSRGYGFSVARYLSGGTIDSSFGTNGLLSTQFEDLSPNALVSKVLLQPDNKMVLIGNVGHLSDFRYSLCLARYNLSETAMLNNFTAVQKTNSIRNISNDVLLYPNPVKNGLHITGLNATANYELKIFDATGKFISGKQIKDNCDYNVQQLSKGVTLLLLLQVTQ